MVISFFPGPPLLFFLLIFSSSADALVLLLVKALEEIDNRFWPVPLPVRLRAFPWSLALLARPGGHAVFCWARSSGVPFFCFILGLQATRRRWRASRPRSPFPFSAESPFFDKYSLGRL